MSARPEPVYRQSGVVPYRRAAGAVEILLVRNLKDSKWICPKGIVERDMSPEQSAAQEAYEEAGVTGEVLSPPIGCYEQRKWGGRCVIDMFAMRVTVELQTWPERRARRRAWFAADRASRACAPAIRHIVSALPGKLDQLEASQP